jgi:short-subunit dehydrogenase
MDLALVTGASSGLGLALAREHASRGGDLVITARREGPLMEAKAAIERQFGVKVAAIPQDLGAPGAAETLYLKVKSRNLSPQILINNAGVGCSGAFVSLPLDEILNLAYLNVISLTSLTRLFLPEMLKSGGRVLNIASVAALVPGPYMAPYYASKAYVDSFTKALWRETLGSKVTVTSCLPGPLRTGFVKASRLKDSKVSSLFTASPEKAAAKAYAAMLKGRRSVMPGVPLWMKAALAAAPLVPDSLVLAITAALQKPRAK